MSASSPPPAALASRLLRRQYEEAGDACDAAYHEVYRQEDEILDLERKLAQARSTHGWAEQTRDSAEARKAELRAALEGLGIEDL